MIPALLFGKYSGTEISWFAPMMRQRDVASGQCDRLTALGMEIQTSLAEPHSVQKI
jgi:hypothetical protein